MSHDDFFEKTGSAGNTQPKQLYAYSAYLDLARKATVAKPNNLVKTPARIGLIDARIALCLKGS